MAAPQLLAEWPDDPKPPREVPDEPIERLEPEERDEEEELLRFQVEPDDEERYP
jgi:hypothetical protein